MHYAANLTVGQSVTGQADSPGYHLALGYWAGVMRGSGVDERLRIYLPVVAK